jgi:deoxycytidylate deaminase
MTKIPQYILDKVRSVAEQGNMRSCHGAGLVDSSGNLISSACNKYINVSDKYLKQGPRINNIKYSLHAEDIVLNSVDRKKINGAKLYVIRLSTLFPDKLACSKPCPRCTKLINKFIKKYKLKSVYYS